MKDATAYGESTTTLLATLSRAGFREDEESGMVRFDIRTSQGETGPMVRALFRAEADFLLNDAAAFDPTRTTRTPQQRRADARVEIVTASVAALDAA
jgi:hypothetical protein